ncbi:hypothetical protein F4804DRAFT_312774 [Jackrogersella minutella]|nr:hypothetical protein F4804DRAFT_312774 [Jackrogersella minutella]
MSRPMRTFLIFFSGAEKKGAFLTKKPNVIKFQDRKRKPHGKIRNIPNPLATFISYIISLIQFAMPADFEKQSYWHERFKSETSFEWLASSGSFMAIIEPQLSELARIKGNTPKILQLGSGTSDLQNYFRANDYPDVTNVDYEPLAIERGRQLEEAAFGDVRMKYIVADATQITSSLPQDKRFDLVVDKSTVDAVSCGGTTAFLRMALGVRRYLAEGGIWISLSYSSSRFDIEELPFDVEVIAKILTPKLKEHDPDVYHHCYLLRPKPVDSQREEWYRDSWRSVIKV